MNKERIIADLLRYKGYFPSQLKFDGERLILFLKKDMTNINSEVKVYFHDFFAFHDSGFIGTKLTYFDIGVLGFGNLYIARRKNLIVEDYFQAVFITELESRKVEMIV
jgi:hypothetical protein